MVKDKKVKPYVTHVAAIKNEALNTYRAKKYLQAMVNDGLLYWDTDKERFRLIETDHRQIELGGL
jgi:predicted transcriptional regulator